jgi:mRNA interferase HigB
MEIRGRKKVLDFMSSGDAKARKLFPGWLTDTEKASWICPSDIRNNNRTVDFLSGNRVVFNIGGNNYRIVVEVDYQRQVVLIRWVGYHKDYDRINARVI